MKRMKGNFAPGFISVGVTSQEKNFIRKNSYAFPFPCKLSGRRPKALDKGGMDQTIIRLRAKQTSRSNLSLRSHRAQGSQYRYAYPGLNKTLFAPIGPNLRCRGHRRATTPKPANSLASGEENHLSGRIKALPRSPMRRDARITVRFPWTGHGEEKRRHYIPPDVKIIDSDSCNLPCSSEFKSSPVGDGRMVGVPASLIGFVVAHHGKDDAEKASAHGNVGLGFTGGFAESGDKPLTDGFLFGIGSAEGNGSLAESPSKGGRTSFGDFAGLSSSGGFLVIRGDTGPEFEGIGIGEAVERTDFGGDDAAPDLGDAGNGF